MITVDSSLFFGEWTYIESVSLVGGTIRAEPGVIGIASSQRQLRGSVKETNIEGAPAIANAVYHATGIRVRELPITIETLLRVRSSTQAGANKRT